MGGVSDDIYRGAMKTSQNCTQRRCQNPVIFTYLHTSEVGEAEFEFEIGLVERNE